MVGRDVLVLKEKIIEDCQDCQEGENVHWVLGIVSRNYN